MDNQELRRALGNEVRRLSGKTGYMSVEELTEALRGVVLGSDASGADAGASDVLMGKKFVGANGTLETGSMVNRGDVSVVLDATTKSYDVPAGYHGGGGSVQVKTQSKSVTPGASAQTVTPDSGYLLSQVNVGAVQASGSIVKSGTVTGGTNNTISINVGFTLLSSDTFIMVYDDSYHDGYTEAQMHTPVLAVKNGSVSYVITASAALSDNGSAYADLDRKGSVTFYGYYADVNTGDANYRFPMKKFLWYVIR